MRISRIGIRWLWVFVFAIALPYMPIRAAGLDRAGRQPFIVYGLLKTEDAMSPGLTTGMVLFSLIGFALIYAALMGTDIFLLTNSPRLIRRMPDQNPWRWNLNVKRSNKAGGNHGSTNSLVCIDCGTLHWFFFLKALTLGWAYCCRSWAGTIPSAGLSSIPSAPIGMGTKSG